MAEDSSRDIRRLIMTRVCYTAAPGERQRDTSDRKSLLRRHSHSIFSFLVYRGGLLPPSSYTILLATTLTHPSAVCDCDRLQEKGTLLLVYAV